MPFLIADLGAFALATVGAIFLLLLPGFGLVRLVRSAGLVDEEAAGWWALVLPLVLLPAVDAVLIRMVGIPAALAIHAALAVAGSGPAIASARAAPVRAWLLAAIWWGIAAYGFADYGDAAGINQPLTVLDTVKHAAVITQISAHGLPLVDPFFARETAAGYYHYFYIGPALIDWLTGTPDARPAFMAGAWSAGLSLFAMLMIVARRCGLVEGVTPRFAAIVAALLCLSGLDILPAAAIWLRWGITLGQLDWWADEVRWGIGSLLWVPHHLSALVAGLAATLFLTSGAPRPVMVGSAGIALASAFGMSLWVAMALVPAMGIWWVADRMRGRGGAELLPLSAAVAAAIALPQFIDLLHGRAEGGLPLMIRPRPFGNGWDTGLWSDIMLLPVSLGLEFGLFAYGAWRWHRGGRGQPTTLHALLPSFAIAGLVVACLVRSTVINNDLAWRAMLLAQMPALLWTAAWLDRGGLDARERAVVLLLGTLGLVTMLADATGLRIVREPAFETTLAFTNRHPLIDAELRQAYHWASGNLPADAVVQHNPAIDERAIAFGLYGRHRTGVADGVAELFGAPRAAVDARVAIVRPLFEAVIEADEVRDRLYRVGADTVLLSSRDPVWQRLGGPPHSWRCAYRSTHVCIMRTAREDGK